MQTSGKEPLRVRRGVRRVKARWQRSIAEFLRVPFALLAAFILLAVGSIALDTIRLPVLAGVHDTISRMLPKDSVSTLLTSIATSVVTITSITFSVLLLAVQQTASSFTPVVFEQFLRRRTNQVYFGFFVGLSFYCFLVLAVLRPDKNPAFSALVALALTLVAFIMLVLIIYGTVDQMRPGTVIRSIHQLAMKARGAEDALLARTRREPRLDADGMTVHATESGYVVEIDLDLLGEAAATCPGEAEIVLEVQLGSHVVFGDAVATAVCPGQPDADKTRSAVLAAISLDDLRDIDVDAGYGVDEMHNIAWAAGSSAHHSPETALTAVAALRDLLARWIAVSGSERERGDELPVVYRDGVLAQAVDALASIGLVTAESREHQTCAEVLTAFAASLPRMPAGEQGLLDDAVRRVLPAVVEHAYSKQLDHALTDLARSLSHAGLDETAGRVDQAAGQLRESTRRILPKPSEHPGSQAMIGEGTPVGIRRRR